MRVLGPVIAESASDVFVFHSKIAQCGTIGAPSIYYEETTNNIAYPRHQSGTPPATLSLAREIAKASGLRHVYTGNVLDEAGQSTYCHACGTCVIGRDWYQITSWQLDENGCCQSCGAHCAGVFQNEPGSWGARRLPIEVSGADQRLRFALGYSPTVQQRMAPRADGSHLDGYPVAKPFEGGWLESRGICCTGKKPKVSIFACIRMPIRWRNGIHTSLT